MNQYNRRKAAESEEPEESKTVLPGSVSGSGRKEVIMEERLYIWFLLCARRLLKRRLRRAHGHRAYLRGKGRQDRED